MKRTNIKIINAYDIYTLETSCNKLIEELELESKNNHINNINILFGNEHNQEYIAIIEYTTYI